MKWIPILIVFVIVLIAGCQPDPIDLEIDQAPSKMVVSSQIIPDRGLILSVSKSFSALSNSEGVNISQQDSRQYLVSNADVSITYNNETYQLDSISSGLYFSFDIKQEENTYYTLNVKDRTTNESISARTYVLPAVAFDSIRINFEDRENDATLIKVNLEFQDIPGKNYYMINFYSNPGRFDPNIVGTGLTQNLISEYAETFILNDEGIENTKIEREITILNGNVNSEDTILCSLSNISKEYYDYLVARKRSGGAFNLLSEPTTIPSNIDGGYGYFAMHYPVPYLVHPR